MFVCLTRGRIRREFQQNLAVRKIYRSCTGKFRLHSAGARVNPVGEPVDCHFGLGFESVHLASRRLAYRPGFNVFDATVRAVILGESFPT